MPCLSAWSKKFLFEIKRKTVLDDIFLVSNKNFYLKTSYLIVKGMENYFLSTDKLFCAGKRIILSGQFSFCPRQSSFCPGQCSFCQGNFSFYLGQFSF